MHMWYILSIGYMVGHYSNFHIRTWLNFMLTKKIYFNVYFWELQTGCLTWYIRYIEVAVVKIEIDFGFESKLESEFYFILQALSPFFFKIISTCQLDWRLWQLIGHQVPM